MGDNMSNNPVLGLGPLLLSLHEGFLDLDDCNLCFDQFMLGLLQLVHCLLPVRAAALHPRRQRRHSILQDPNHVVTVTDMTLGGYKEVGESFGAHEDNLLLRPGYVGVVRIAFICSGEKRTYRHRCRDRCLRRRGKGHGGL